MNISRYTKIIIFTMTLVLLTNCIDPPNDFVAPTYDVGLNFPVMDSILTLSDFTEADSNFVASSDPDKLGLLYYKISNEIIPIKLDDKLEMESIEASSSTTIGSIRIEDTPYIEANIGISELAPISEGSDVIFLPMSSQFEADFEEIDDFTSADFESGNMELTVSNNLPVPIVLENISIMNSDDHSVIGQFPSSTQLSIPPFDSAKVELPLDNKQVRSQLKVSGDVSTNGSNGEIISVPIGAGIKSTLRFTDFILDRVTAILPEQDELQMDSSLVINDSTKVETAIFEDGRILFFISNFIDLDINVCLQFDELMMSDGTPYNETFTISRSSQNQVFEVTSLKGWQIRSNNSRELLEELSYSIKVNSEATEDERTITQDDSINVQFLLEDAVLSYARGLIKPTPFEIEASELAIDLGEMENKLSFDSLFLNTPNLNLVINSSINFDVLLNGKIIGISDKITKELPIILELPSLVNANFDLVDQGISEFINSFTIAGAIPTKFIFSGTGIVNPHYTIGSVSSSDSVYGSSNFEFPFDFGIAGGFYIDTLDVNLNLTEDEIESINSILLTFETDNKIPVNLIMNGEILDNYGNQLTKIPPSYNMQEYLYIESPQVNENGEVISSQLSTQKIELRSSEAKEFARNPNLVLSMMFDTPPLSSIENVKFKTSDNIYFKIYGSVDYRVNR